MDREFLQRLRSELGISQADLGRRLGISQSQVSRALSGRGHLKSAASAAAFKLADDHAPEIADEARLLDRTTEALRESKAFRDLVRAALRIIHESA
ncbi:MAG: helix-turn-helix transcriptional regulator [Methylobacterium organophilum]|nr:helix-turn-helix transcriptional regulator [Methylobacterium organophilum]